MSDELVNQDKVTILEGDLVTQFWLRGRVNRYPAYTFLAKVHDVGSFFCERPRRSLSRRSRSTTSVSISSASAYFIHEQ